MKKQSNLQRLLNYAEKRKALAYLSWVLIYIAGLMCSHMSGMTGKEMQRKMTEYQNALADMSNEAVEYVRGIPVVKTFGQTVFPLKNLRLQ